MGKICLLVFRFLLLTYLLNICMGRIGSPLYAQAIEEQAQLTASDWEAEDWFGASSAASGNTVVIGATGNDFLGLNGQEGKAYVFSRDSSGAWLEQQSLAASDLAAGDAFGFAVAIHGNTVVIAAPFKDEGLADAGAVYVFQQSANGSWQEVGKLMSPHKESGELFGRSVAIWGDEIIIGANNSTSGQNGGDFVGLAGAAYVFKEDYNGQWNFVQKLLASDRSSGAHFGGRIARTDSLLIVGADFDQKGLTVSSPSIYNSGSAYVFQKTQQGNWQEVSKLKASDAGPYEYFGRSVGIDGSTIVVGATQSGRVDPVPSGIGGTGAVYVYEPDSSGQWLEKQRIVPSDSAIDDHFGNALAIQEDRLLVGAEFKVVTNLAGDSLDYAGAAYLFYKNADGSWEEEETLIASDRAYGYSFGRSVSIADSGLLVGCSNTERVDSYQQIVSNVGTMYVFELCENSTSSTIFPQACNEYISPSGTQTYTQTGTYTDITQNAEGCDSIITIKLALNTVDVSVQQSGLTLTANAAGLTYQWLDCRRGMQAIPGATSQSFSDVHGIYAVAITGACTDTSDCISTYVTGLESEPKFPSIDIFPNPTSGSVTVQLEQVEPVLDLRVSNVLGEVVYQETILRKKEFTLSLESPPGIYILQLRDPSGKIQSFRLLKQ